MFAYRVCCSLIVVIPPIKKPRRKVYRYQKGDYESVRSDALRFAKERYFNGHKRKVLQRTQKKGTSTDTQILAQFKKSLT